jgi:cytoskeletal protein RodZ
VASSSGPDDPSGLGLATESVGTVLRRLREARGLTLDAVALETRIPAVSLRKLEEEQYDDLPGQVFVRGFLRAYARAVGADPEDIILLFEHRHGPSVPPKASRWPGLFLMPRRRRVGLFVAVLVALTLLGLLVAFVYRGSDAETPPTRPDAGAADAGP